ncbi:hypothetical protein CR970_01120 [Candidatus Saccharibacteria bacterium]|nr:MAG: hypothetical protein CR970_01120 [Candidatus Saccharibacteria bacterium]
MAGIRGIRIALAAIAVAVAAPVAFAGVAGAAPSQFTKNCKGAAANSSYCQSLRESETQGNNSFYGSNGVINNVANIIAVLTGTAAVIVIIVSGIRFTLAEGDSGKIRDARNSIIYALVGLVVVVVARSLIGFVLTRL